MMDPMAPLSASTTTLKPIEDPWATAAVTGAPAPIEDPWAQNATPVPPPPAETPTLGVWDTVKRAAEEIARNPLKAAGETALGVALGAGRAAGIAEQGIGGAIEGIGNLFDRDDDPRTLNKMQRLGRNITRRGEDITEAADIYEFDTTIGKLSKFAGDVGTEALATVVTAGRLPGGIVSRVGGAAGKIGASPAVQRALGESIKYAVASAPTTAARSFAGESAVKAAAQLMGDEELAQTLEGSMAQTILYDLGLNTVLGAALDVGFAKLVQMKQGLAKAAAKAPDVPPPSSAGPAGMLPPGPQPVMDPTRLLPTGRAIPTPGASVLGPPIPMPSQFPTPTPGQFQFGPGLPGQNPMVDPNARLAAAAAQAPPPPLIEVVEGGARSSRTQQRGMSEAEYGEWLRTNRGRSSEQVMQVPNAEATEVLELARKSGEAARRNQGGIILNASVIPGLDQLNSAIGRQALRTGGLVGVGMSLQDAEDERLQATGRGLVTLGVLSAMYPALRSAGIRGGGALRTELMKSPTGTKLLNILSHDLTMDPVVQGVVREYEGTIARGKARAAEFSDAAAKQGASADRQISDLIERENFEPVAGDLAPGVISLAQKIADEFTAIGRVKVGLGLMGQGTFDARAGNYLPRMYAKFMGEDAMLDVPLAGSRKARLEGDIRRQNLSPEIRNALGEVREASVRTKVGLERQYRQIATAKLFDDLAHIPGVILPESVVAKEAFYAARRAYQDALANPKITRVEKQALLLQQRNAKRMYDEVGQTFAKPKAGYQRLPDTPGMGQLAGAVVRDDVAAYLKGLPQMMQRDAYGDILRLWKKTKTVYNLGTHVGNFVSNIAMAHMGGLPYWEVIATDAIPKAVKALKGYDPDVRFLAERGVLDRGLPTSGDPRLVSSPEDALRALMETTRPETRAALADAGLTPKPAWQKAAEKVDRKVTDLYGAEDAVFRVALFKKLTKEGMAQDEAADFVLKQFVDYSTRSPALRTIGRYASPFVLFGAKAIPRILDQVLERPERWATLAMLWGGMDMYSRMKVGPIDFNDLPEGERNKSYLIPGRVQLPNVGQLGEMYTLDVARWTPFSALTGSPAPGTALGQLNVQGVPAMVSLSGPLLDIGNMVAGRDSYTGDPVISPSMSVGEKLQVYGKEIIKFVAPSALGFHVPRVASDLQNLDTKAAMVNALGLVGARPRVVRPGQEATFAEYEFNRALGDANKRYQKAMEKAERNPRRQDRLTGEYEQTLLRLEADYLTRLGELDAARQVLQEKNALNVGVQYTPR